MKKARTSSFSSTTFSVSCRPTPRSPHCSDACPAPSAISPLSAPTWASSRNASPPPRKARSRRCRQSTSPPTTTPTLRRRPLSRIWTPSPPSIARFSKKESSPRSIRSDRTREFSIRKSSAKSTTASRARCRQSCSATRTCRTSSRSSGWKNCRLKIKPSSPARAASSAFCRRRCSSRSRSPINPASTSSARTPCAASRKSSKANATTCPSRPSTWSAQSRTPAKKPRSLARGE